MITPELMAQVKAQLASGMKRVDIEQILRVAGIEEVDMANVFTLLEMAKASAPTQATSMDPTTLVAPIEPNPPAAPAAPPIMPPPQPISQQFAQTTVLPVISAPVIPKVPPPPVPKPPVETPKLQAEVPVQSAITAPSAALPKAVVPPPPPSAPSSTSFGVLPRPTSQSAVVGPARNSSRLGVWLGIFLLVVFVVGVGGLVAFEKMYPDAYKQILQDQYHIPPLSATVEGYLSAYIPVAEKASEYEDLYQKYCATNVSGPASVKVPLIVMSSTYTEISAAIEAAKAENSTEKLALLHDAVAKSAYIKDFSQTLVGKDAVQAKSGDAFSKQFAPLGQQLNTLFTAFQKAGLTPNNWLQKVKVDVQDHEVTQDEFAVYLAWYENTKDPAFAKLSSAQKIKQTSILLAYLAEIHQLLKKISDARGELAQEHNAATAKSLAEATVASSVQALTNAKPEDRNIGFELSLLGVAILKERKDFAESFRFQQCAAQKYYDPFSMYNLGGYYGRGVNTTVYPDLVVKAPLEKDMKTAYFWNVALVLVDRFHYGDFTNPALQTGATTIAALDGIRKAAGLTETELVTIENQARDFVAKKYPDVAEKTSETAPDDSGNAASSLEKSAGTSTSKQTPQSAQ